MRYLLVIVGFFLFSCNTKTSSSEVLKKKQINGYLVKANFIDDTLINGIASFFKDDKLSIKEHYKYGIRDGASVSFYSNGNIYDSSNYINGYKNGYYFVYDSSGKLRYECFFYKGDQLGPELGIHNGLITNYYFYSREGEVLYSAEYDSFHQLTQKGSFYNTIPRQFYIGANLYYGVFAYLIYPPKMNVIYELISKKSGQENSLKKFNQEVFFDTTFLPNKDEKYFMKIIADDSVSGKGKVYYDELVYQ